MAKISLPVLVGVMSAYLLIELSSLWKGHSDLAIKLVGNPYGLFWSLTNPFYLEDFLYKVYLTGFIVGIVALQLFLYKKGKLSFLVILLNQFTNFWWIMQTGFQHITMTAWQALSFYNPVFMILWVFSEFPIGNSWGWWCLSNKDGFTYGGTYFQTCGSGTLFGSIGLIEWHLIEGLWVLGPTIYWAYKWKVWRWIKKK